jgi:hypothetical protein
LGWSPGSPYCPYWWRKHTRTNFWRKNQRSNGTLARRARSDRRHSGSTRAGFGSPFWRHSDIARHARTRNMEEEEQEEQEQGEEEEEEEEKRRKRRRRERRKRREARARTNKSNTLTANTN